MAVNCYMKIEDPVIDGESTDAGHAKELEILSWSHGFSQTTSSTRSTAGSGTVERADHQDFSFSKYLDKSMQAIMKTCWMGDQINKAVVTMYRSADKNPIPYLTITMEEIIVSSYSISGGGGDVPIENISFAYAKVEYKYTEQSKDTGEKGGALPISHNLSTNAIA